MYDPDLAVYYRTQDGRVAGVEELGATPALIAEPFEPIFGDSSYEYPYSQFIADFYSSTDNNFDGGQVFLPDHQTPSARIVLPPGARLTYPGRWTEPPMGYDGVLPYQVKHYHQAMLELDDGWTGEVALPWMVWALFGAGEVGIEGSAFEIGSPELTERLRNADAPVTSLNVYTGSGIQIVFFINAVRFNIRPETQVSVRGLDVWAIAVRDVLLSPEVAAGASLDASLKKPLPTTIR
jgi:hypothetical protein